MRETENELSDFLRTPLNLGPQKWKVTLIHWDGTEEVREYITPRAKHTVMLDDVHAQTGCKGYCTEHRGHAWRKVAS